MAGTNRLDLLSNVSATGSGFGFNGGKAALYAEATWGGGTVKLQTQSPKGTWIDVPNASFTANGFVSLDLPPGQYRGNVATATAVYFSLVSIPVRTQ